MRKISLSHSLPFAAATATLVFHGFGFAADAPAPGAQRAPSPAAIAACNGKIEGASVSWVGRKGVQRSGTCTKVDNVLAARMARHGAPGAASGAGK